MTVKILLHKTMFIRTEIRSLVFISPMWQNKFVREGDKVRNLRKTYLLEFLDLATFRLNVRGEALICLLTSPFLAIS